MQFPERLDTLIAYKMIALIPDLSAAEQRVAASVIDHFNRNDGRCDPSVERLATLLGVTTRTIIRSLETLDERDLISKDRHGGRSLRNSYEPNWAKFRAFEEVWRASFNAGRAAPAVTNPSDKRCPESQVPGDLPVTQTFTENPSRKPVREGYASGGIHRSRGGEAAGQPRREIKDGSFVTQHPNGQAVASEVALRGWDADLRHHDQRLYELIVAFIDEDACAAITTAECHRRGEGLRYILEHRLELLGSVGERS